MPSFSPDLFTFLRELTAHNERDWFAANKHRFEADVKIPLHAFVHALGPKLEALDPDAIANDKSVFRIYRDTRFSKDKIPYKTHASAQFARGTARGPGATGYYLHLDPAGSFFAGGLWMPEPSIAARIRARIDTHQPTWIVAKNAAGGLGEGESLARVPKPWAADHPLADDLRRKSFIASVRFTEADVVGDGFVDVVAAAAGRLVPLVRFLADATG